MVADFKFTYDWFSRAIPDWWRELAPMAGAADLRFAEVGVYEGDGPPCGYCVMY